jgi:hypothetical protein
MGFGVTEPSVSIMMSGAMISDIIDSNRC